MLRDQLQHFGRGHQIAALLVGLSVIAHPSGGASCRLLRSEPAPDAPKATAENSAHLCNETLAPRGDNDCTAHGVSSLPVDSHVIRRAVSTVVQDQIALSVVASHAGPLALDARARHVGQVCMLLPVGVKLSDEHGALTDSAPGLVDGDDHGCYPPFGPAARVAGVTSGRSAAGSVLTCCQRGNSRTGARGRQQVISAATASVHSTLQPKPLQPASLATP
jgi:hypothetical protein